MTASLPRAQTACAPGVQHREEPAIRLPRRQEVIDRCDGPSPGVQQRDASSISDWMVFWRYPRPPSGNCRTAMNPLLRAPSVDAAAVMAVPFRSTVTISLITRPSRYAVFALDGTLHPGTLGLSLLKVLKVPSRTRCPLRSDVSTTVDGPDETTVDSAENAPRRPREPFGCKAMVTLMNRSRPRPPIGALERGSVVLTVFALEAGARAGACRQAVGGGQ